MRDARAWPTDLRRWRRLLRGLALAAAAVAALGGARCRAEVRLGTGVFADGAHEPRGADLVGTWRRVVVVETGAGTRSVETTWTFASEGEVAVREVARNLNGELDDAVDRRGRWRTEGGGVVVIDFTTPADERRRLAWRVERGSAGEVLTLDGVRYTRAWA